MALLFENNSLEMKVSVMWKCFDGIQRTDVPKSDVRNMFEFEKRSASPSSYAACSLKKVVCKITSILYFFKNLVSANFAL